MKSIYFNNREFKHYKSDYYVGSFGEIYSTKSHKFLKWLYRGKAGKKYPYVDIDGKHEYIHKIVYLVWIGPIPEGMQINHRDDNVDNCHYSNLYAGTQKENIRDCAINGHRVGNKHKFIVLDKLVNAALEFDCAKDFLSYAGHVQANGGVSKCFDRLWFKRRYAVLQYGNEV